MGGAEEQHREGFDQDLFPGVLQRADEYVTADGESCLTSILADSFLLPCTDRPCAQAEDMEFSECREFNLVAALALGA